MSAAGGPGSDARNRATLLAEAMERHRRGALDEAAGIYRRVLAMDPRDFDALHMLGVVAAQRGEGEEAIALLSAAADARPASARASRSRRRALPVPSDRPRAAYRVDAHGRYAGGNRHQGWR